MTNIPIATLNLPVYNFRINVSGQSKQIFDCVRRKFVALTPEEWVRQHMVMFLIENCEFPQSSLAVEKQVKYNNLIKRFDIMAYDIHGRPMLVVECKAPGLKPRQATFDQVSRYCLATGANRFIVTNGYDHHICSIDHSRQRYDFIDQFPKYKDITA
jgi:type I site-specific restriction-modification system R (restriction) subunit